MEKITIENFTTQMFAMALDKYAADNKASIDSARELAYQNIENNVAKILAEIKATAAVENTKMDTELENQSRFENISP